MTSENSPTINLQIYYRLIALWVICEAVLGGMIHGLKLPISGLIVGSCAVICICLIAYYVPVRGAILKATVIVAVFKMMLSPHSPPAAYIAVFFQGALGQLLFTNKNFFKTSCIILGVLALVESAVQRILVLIILYGATFWKAINEFISKITGSTTITNYSWIFAVSYIILHALVGLGVGMLAIYLVKKSRSFSVEHKAFLVNPQSQNLRTTRPKNKKIKIILFTCWVILLVLIAQSIFQPGTPILPLNTSIQILIRSLLILLSWYLIVNPLITYYFKNWLRSQHVKSGSHLSQVALLLPSTQYLFTKSWELSASKKGIARIVECCKIILINTLYPHV